MYKLKKCRICGKEFQPKNSNHAMCSDECRDTYYRTKGLNKTYRNGVYIPTGYHQTKENNNNWKGGVEYRYLVSIEKCEKCGSTKNLLVHHIDENRSHNVKENLMVLCKSVIKICTVLEMKRADLHPERYSLTRLLKAVLKYHESGGVSVYIRYGC